MLFWAILCFLLFLPPSIVKADPPNPIKLTYPSTFSGSSQNNRGQAQVNFLSNLRDELNEQNPEIQLAPFGCNNFFDGLLSVRCSYGELIELDITRLTLTSIPSSISTYSNSLTYASINVFDLSQLGDGFSKLEKLNHLALINTKLRLPDYIGSFTDLSFLALNSNRFSEVPNWISYLTLLKILFFNDNQITSIPTFFSNLTVLTSLDLSHNSLLSLPDELINLPSLEILALSHNPSLRVDISDFETGNIVQLLVDETLVTGRVNFGISIFEYDNSCISAYGYTKNPSCDCESFTPTDCPSDFCAVNANSLCVDCYMVRSQKQCSGGCNWCEGLRDGFQCFWCEFKKDECKNDQEYCDPCLARKTQGSCSNDDECEWCEFNYCAITGQCEKACPLLSKDECELVPEYCSWCATFETCLNVSSQCLACDRFSEAFCPPSCDCASGSNSNSTVIVVVCVVCCVVFLSICACVLIFFLIKRKAFLRPNSLKSLTNSNSSLQFDESFYAESPEHSIISKYTECSVDSLFQVSHKTLTFNSSDSPLKLCSSATMSFELTNKSGFDLAVESLFVKGFKEKHELVFSPSSFTIGANEKRKISVELTMKCSATLTHSQSFICCGISTKRQWCSLCGIQAQSELSSLLSCDDIELKRELGRGAFGKVFLGSFKGTEVAVKMYSAFTKEDNEKEANMFSKLHSPHIVTFYGISQTLNAMIIEYCKYGSVESLYDRREMNFEMKLLICYDCSLGVKYLHSNGIIHRDLKPDNLLIVSFSKDLNTVRAKISDFGTSRFMNQTVVMTESVGTPSYMAPEVFNNEAYGKKSDVYSFGLTAWSIYSKILPYSEYPNVQTIMMKVNEGCRPQLCHDCPLNDLIEQCWQKNPIQRPPFEEIVDSVKKQIDQINTL